MLVKGSQCSSLMALRSHGALPSERHAVMSTLLKQNNRFCQLRLNSTKLQEDSDGLCIMSCCLLCLRFIWLGVVVASEYFLIGKKLDGGGRRRLKNGDEFDGPT